MILIFTFLILFASLAWVLAIWNFIKIIFVLLYKSLISIYQYFAVTKPMINSGFIEKKRIEQKLIEEEKNIKQQKKVLEQHNMIINAALSKVRDLRIRFPYAEEDLFQLYLKKYPAYSTHELQEIENKIKNNHIENEIKFSLQNENEKSYNLKDLEGLDYLEEDKELPLIMKIYKINNDYLIHIRDVESNYDALYKSKDYLALYRIIFKIRQKIEELKQYKQSITAKDIDNISMNTIANTNNFRINRMGFLD